MDASDNSIEVAKAHLNTYEGSEKKYFNDRIEYFIGSVDDFIAKYPTKQVDTITAMEVIEHVNMPFDFLVAVNKILKNNGFIFLSTINKNYLSYLSTIVCINSTNL